MRTIRAIATSIAVVGAALGASGLFAQENTVPPLGEMMVTGTRSAVPYAQQDRPVIGLRRRADAAVMMLNISSDTREAGPRIAEIHAALLAAMDKAAAAGLEIVAGGNPLYRVTRENYKLLPLPGAGRVDTNMVQVMVKAPLQGTAQATQARLAGFVSGLKGTGRATISQPAGISLTIVDPDQYRSAIVAAVAADAKATAAQFGSDFTFSVTGIDGQIVWSQVSPSEVFLFIPYRYTIVPKR
jgi:hypothetical protein